MFNFDFISIKFSKNYNHIDILISDCKSFKIIYDYKAICDDFDSGLFCVPEPCKRGKCSKGYECNKEGYCIKPKKPPGPICR